MFVVYWRTELRDGSEEGAKVVPTLGKAEELLTSLVNGFDGENTSVKLFKLGEEVRLLRGTETVEEKVIKKKTVIKVPTFND